MSSQSAVTDRIRSLDDDEFPRFLAELWRAAEWNVDRVDDVLLASRETDAGTERIVLVALTPTGFVTEAGVHDAVERRDVHDADGVTAVAPTGFTTAALDVADAYGVDAVGPESAARLVVALGAEDLLH